MAGHRRVTAPRPGRHGDFAEEPMFARCDASACRSSPTCPCAARSQATVCICVIRSSRPLSRHFSIQSAHFATAALPQGMIGTEEVEFLGDPSIILSLKTMYTRTFRFTSQPRTICIFLKNRERRLRKTSSPCSNFALKVIGPIWLHDSEISDTSSAMPIHPLNPPRSGTVK